MNKTKTFLQYSDVDLRIIFKVNNDGSFNKRTEVIDKDCRKKYKKEYCINNKDKIKKHKKEYRIRNKDKIIEYKKIYYKKNKEIISKKKKEYRKNNPNKVRIMDHKRKEKRKSWGDPIPINLYFEGSHLHHIHIHNKRTCIYVPGNLHNSISHRNTNKASMNEINNAVINWLLKSVYEAIIEKSL